MTHLTSIKGVIFDFGNVLGGFNHQRSCEALLRYTELHLDEVNRLLFEGRDAPTKLHETGELTSTAFFEAVSKVIGLSGTLAYDQFCTIWGDIFTPNEGIESLLARIHPGMPLCVLSNTDPIHWGRIQQMSVVQRFFPNNSRHVLSFTSRVRKPHIKIYNDALCSLGLDWEQAGHVVYIDDIPEFRQRFTDCIRGNVIAYDCSKDPLSVLEAGLKRYNLLA